MKNFDSNTYEQFGSLLFDFNFEAGDYDVYPNENFSARIKLIKEKINKGDFLYPPYITQHPVGSDNNSIEIPNTSRPASIHRVIPTHIIANRNGKELPLDFIENHGLLFTRLLDVLYETHTQFKKWWWSGRVHFDKNDSYWLNKEDLKNIFLVSFSNWEKWNEKEKLIFFKLLFLFFTFYNL